MHGKMLSDSVPGYLKRIYGCRWYKGLETVKMFYFCQLNFFCWCRFAHHTRLLKTKRETSSPKICMERHCMYICTTISVKKQIHIYNWNASKLEFFQHFFAQEKMKLIFILHSICICFRHHTHLIISLLFMLFFFFFIHLVCSPKTHTHNIFHHNLFSFNSNIFFFFCFCS